MTNYVKCKVCGSCISVDTGYEYIPCACGTIAVDGGPDYCRIIGGFENYQIVDENGEEVKVERD